MYDFYFGSRSDILKDEIKFLVSVKRMLPKWTNSIPDSEFSAICRLIQTLAKRPRSTPLVLAETGVGASSLALGYYAMKTGGRAYSWDINGEKGSLLRTVMTETFGNVFSRSINDHWKMVAYNSLSPHLGLPILGELEKKVDFFMHDSHHVLETVLGEMKLISPLMKEGGIIALDDANYDFLHTDEAYINVLRRKLHLASIPPLKKNKSKPFYLEISDFLKTQWKKIKPMDQFYRSALRGDVFFAYFDTETRIRAKMGMERYKALEHRLHAWRVSGRRRGGA